MLVRAQFVETRYDAGDSLWLMKLSREDQRLLQLNAAGIREWDLAYRSLQDDESDEAEIVRAGFYARMPFKVDASERHGEDSPQPTLLPPMTPHTEVWMFLASPFRVRRTLTTGIQGWKVSVFDVVGVYPVLTDIGRPESMASPPQNLWDAVTLMRTLRTNLWAGGVPALLDACYEQLGEVDLNRWMRTAGVLLGLPLLAPMLAAGHAMYDVGSQELQLEEAYRLFSLTTEDARFVESRVPDPESYLLPGSIESLEHMELRPLLTSVQDLSNPHEFGTAGVLWMASLLTSPLGWVGPAASGGAPKGRGSGVERRLPFWVCDLLSHTLYGSTGEAQPRGEAVVGEAVRHLEQRNDRALQLFSRNGTPLRDDDDRKHGFDFDAQGPLPRGSTLFSQSLIEAAIDRRVRDLEGAVERSREVYIGESRRLNPYQALAGFVGQRLRPLHELGHTAARLAVMHRTLRGVQTRDEITGRDTTFWGLKDRIDLQAKALTYLQQQEVAGTESPLLDIDLATLFEESPSPSQRQAMQNILRWRVSVVVGEPGSGKTSLARPLQRLVRQITAQSTAARRVLLVAVSPANVGVTELAYHLPDAFRIGGSVKLDPETLDQVDTLIGTLDGLLYMLDHGSQVGALLQSNPVVLYVDEAGRAAADRLVSLLDTVSAATETGGGLLRLVLAGDPPQLLPVQPGDLLADALAVAPAARLVENFRFGTAADPHTGALADLMSLTHRALYNASAREELCGRLLRWSVDQAEHPCLRVVLVDDLPKTADEQDWQDPGFFQQHRQDVDHQVRNAVMSSALAWTPDCTLRGCTSDDFQLPRVPQGVKHSSLTAAARLGYDDFERFRQAVLYPTLPFVVATLRKGMQSWHPTRALRTHHVSSAERINGWFHDVLLGWWPPNDPQWDAPGPLSAMEYRMVGDDCLWYPPNAAASAVRTRFMDLLRGSSRDRQVLRRLLTDYRPPFTTLMEGWPYWLMTNDHHRQGFHRNTRLRYVASQRRNGRDAHQFVNDSGDELMLSTPQVITDVAYGWASNVDQLQSSEHPMVMLVWVDGLSPVWIARNWRWIRPSEDPLSPLSPRVFGGRDPALDDTLSLRAFYSAISRTQARPRRQLEIGGEAVQQEHLGRLVLIVGRHALRRILTLKAMQRRTGVEGLLLESLCGKT